MAGTKVPVPKPAPPEGAPSEDQGVQTVEDELDSPNFDSLAGIDTNTRSMLHLLILWSPTASGVLIE